MTSMMMVDQNKEYVLNELQLPLPGFNLYNDKPAHLSHNGMQSLEVVLAIDSSKLEQVRSLYSIDAWMMTSYAVFLHRMTNDKDLIMGVRNRTGRLLPLRVAITGSDSFKSILEQISSKLEMLDSTELQLSDMERICGQSPLFQTIYGEDTACQHSLLNWYVREEADMWLLKVSYSSFNEPMIRKYSRHFEALIHSVLEHMDMELPIGSLAICTEEDLNAYAVLNAPKLDVSPDMTIVSMLASVVERFGDRIAISYDEDGFTYSELDRLSNKVANMLLESGLQRGQFVSLFMDRSLDTIISLLGVIKAGGVYVPLDPAHPDERNAYIISDTSSLHRHHQERVCSQAGCIAGQSDRQAEAVFPRHGAPALWGAKDCHYH